MEEWKEYKLKEVTSVLGDGIHGTPKYDDNGSIFFINGNNLENGRIVIKDTTKRVSEREAEKYKKPLCDRTLMVSINGTLGNVARYNGEPCILGKSACFFNVKEDFEKDFIYYVVNNQYFRNEIERLATGTTIKNVSLETMRHYSFLVPSLDIQRRIASILSSLDDKIELNRKINANLEAQAQALFKSWFVDFEPFKDQPFVESELGMIPEGWRVGTLGEICNQSSIKVGCRNDVKVLSPVTTGNLMLSEEYFTKQVFSESIAKYKVVTKGAFAYNPARVNIGSLGRNEYDFDGAVSPVYVVFECKDGYENFFDLYRRTERFKTEVSLRAIGGVRQSLNYTDFAMIQTIIAPQNVIDAFNPLFDNIKETQRHIEKENSRLASLRDTLLPRLMSGELKVNEVI